MARNTASTVERMASKASQAKASPAKAAKTVVADDPLLLLLSVAQAGKRLGISRAKMYGMVMRGEVLSIMVGSNRKVPVEALAVYIRTQCQRQRVPLDIAG